MSQAGPRAGGRGTCDSAAASGSAQDSSEPATSASTGAGAVGDVADLAGTWTPVADGASFVGCRVREELASIGATTAVGRTVAVSGTLAFDGSAIAAAAVEADVTARESDEDGRRRFDDHRLRGLRHRDSAVDGRALSGRPVDDRAAARLRAI